MNVHNRPCLCSFCAKMFIQAFSQTRLSAVGNRCHIIKLSEAHAMLLFKEKKVWGDQRV